MKKQLNEIQRMQQLAGLLTEIKVNDPNKINHILKELIDFFKNDTDIFEGSNIYKIIMKHRHEIANEAWVLYDDVYKENDIEYHTDDPDEKEALQSVVDLSDENKQTMGSEDAMYKASGIYIFSFICDWLKKEEWISEGDSEFRKDEREEDIFDYIKPFQEYDTDPREMLWEEFNEYIEENY